MPPGWPLTTYEGIQPGSHMGQTDRTQLFDRWAETYDGTIAPTHFPFVGYDQVLDEVVRLAEVRPHMQVLDLSSGRIAGTQTNSIGRQMKPAQHVHELVWKSHIDKYPAVGVFSFSQTRARANERS